MFALITAVHASGVFVHSINSYKYTNFLLSFYFIAIGIIVFFSGGNSRGLYSNETIWRVFGIMKDGEWHYAQANISAGTHNLLFEVNGDNYRAGIKNITVVPGYCPDYSKYFSLQD